MKRRIIPFAAAALLAVSSMAAQVALGAPPDKVACADITAGNGSTDPAGTAYDFEFGMETAEPCGGVVFTMYVFANEAACASPQNALATVVVHGAKAAADGVHGEVVFTAKAVADDDGTVWVYATSNYRKALVDRAPDTGCTDYGDEPFAKPFG